MTALDLPDVTSSDGTSVLSWLQSVADRNQPDDVAPTIIPVAWMGRTSTDDQQDPTLSLPRQLENTRRALPAPFVIVAKFYDIESGRNDLEFRGQGDAHERFDIPIARDGGIADMLEEARRPDRRFVAVACESIERVARVSYFSTKIEYELAQVGVALLAADEGIKSDAVVRTGGERPKQATQILTRRVKQAISEWYVVNMLELSWDGVMEHTRQGWNIGKPPYGYVAERHPHPVKAKRDDGKVKTRLVPDPLRGPVVTQIFQWRALHRLGAQDIAERLNADLDRYPPPQPIPGKGRRAVGAWTKTSVLDLLANPKYTGYMVWNRRKRSSPERHVSGKVNPPSEWVWSPRPTHEPLVTAAIFDAAVPISRLRRGSRGGAGPNAAHRQARRSYLLRSYLVCDICERRMFGKVRVRRVQETIYYACVTNPEHHRDQPWYAQHPKNLTVREDHLLPVVGRFFGERVLGPHRAVYLVQRQPQTDDAGAAKQRAALRTQLEQLGRAQTNLIRQLEEYEPTGDDDLDAEWRGALQRRFAEITAQRRVVTSRLAGLDREDTDRGGGNAALLDLLPKGAIDPTLLPEEDQRELYDAFHLQLRYDRPRHQVTLRVTIYAEAVSTLSSKIHSLDAYQPPAATAVDETDTARSHVVSAPGSIRTCATGRQLVLPETFGTTPGTVDQVLMSGHVEVDGKLLDDVAAGLGVDVRNIDQLKNLAAVAITRIAWRDGPVEDWHAGRWAAIGDGEMMRTNAATTRLIREVMDRTSAPGAMFYHAGQVLADPCRRLPDGRTLVALAPSALELTRYRAHVAACYAKWVMTAAEIGEMTVLTLLALYGARYGWRWWRSIAWPQLAEEFIRRLDDPQRWESAWELDNRRRLGNPPGGATSQELLRLLLAGPDCLDVATAEFCLRAGLSALIPQHCGLPPVQRRPLPAGYFALVKPD